MTCRAERDRFPFLLIFSHTVAVWLGLLGTNLRSGLTKWNENWAWSQVSWERACSLLHKSILLSLSLRLFWLPHFSGRISLFRNHKPLVIQATLAGSQIADAEKKTRRKPESVRPNCFCKRLQGPVYFSLLKWRVEGHLLNKNGSYWRMNRPMLTQQHFPGNVPRIQFYAHLQRPRLRCIAWTSPKKNKYYATIKFFKKRYSTPQT